MARIMYFARFGALWSIETRRESCSLGGVEHFGALKHAANHAFYEVWSTSEYETRRESCILRGFDLLGAFKCAWDLNLISLPKMAPG